ncbi:MAG: hypothetical protein CMD74_03610 [Gammaproteobacteria bacterium]|nr:hypothetical protein [Gammaproteobacteria bacterium]
MRPDKAKIIDEVWDDDRIRSFLAKASMGSEKSSDFSALLNAYRSMRANDFERFIEYFQSAGRSVRATSNQGLTLLDIISGHAKSQSFRDILEKAMLNESE